jgi:integrase
MACPTKRSGSDNWYFRRKLPSDIRTILEKLSKAQRPRNWHRAEIMISLRTADRATAKARCAEVAAEVEKQMAGLRAGPKALTPKQIAALAGELYRGFAEGLEDDPVLSSKKWREIAQVNQAAREGAFAPPLFELGIGRTKADKALVSSEKLFGSFVDAFIKQRGIFTTEESRLKLIERFSVEAVEAAKKLARNADGDYSPDIYAAKFPPFEQAADKSASKKSLKALAEAWHRAAPDRGVKARDANRIKARFNWLIGFLQHDDADRVTKQDIVRWRDHRLATKKSVKTINDSDIASFNSVFNWGVERGWLAQNPADGMAIKQKRHTAKLREEYFTPEEARAVLLRAASVLATPKENAKTTAAKRWVPWLCAYSGARVMEMIQLRKQDVRKDATHGWVIRLTPEAGDIKTNTFCDVPVHEHLEATGFIEFVKTAKDGHLFCNRAKDGSITGSAEGVYKRIYTMVKEVVPSGVQPNHAWRYTFKTCGSDAGIAGHVLDAITNHAPKHQGGKYTKVTLKARADAMRMFPRYELT